jgi:protein-L-isoaspartate(D-aspartate) O-methyltransferase
MRDRFRVLLIWPGGLFEHSKSFGVPHLLGLAGALHSSEVDVSVVDLDLERAFGPVDLGRIVSRAYDLIGLSCYSSFDYLKTMAIAGRLRRLAPAARLVVGGYHPSARPDDFTREDSPFDYVVVGDGECPLRRLVEALVQGKPPASRVLPVEPTQDIGSLPPTDWGLLERYRTVARKMASQAQIHLSRGCPFSCSFCMERAKRCTAWRAFEPERAVEELHRLDAFLDLSSWTLFVTDALFGLTRPWRRGFLEALVRKPIRARKVWLLARADLLDREDLALMARANVAPGFGLESGSPTQLARIHKAGSAELFLHHVRDVARWARELDLPFGANVIVGHPGETEATLRESHAFLEEVFLEGDRTTGFLSIDPFRLYPGSAIDQDLDAWVRTTGMHAHRYPWWEDGDQDFLSEWVDPSRELDFRTTLRLRFELFGPLVRKIASHFALGDTEARYFRRSVDEAVAQHEPRRQLRILGLSHLWNELTETVPDARAAIAGDHELARVAREARKRTLESPRFDGIASALREALESVPRERFVRTEEIDRSAEDRALPLSDTRQSTISALHAYATSFRALGLREGDTLVDLGGGTGYGAAIAAHVVGELGSVVTVEVDDALSTLASENLAGAANVRVVHADAHEVACWRGALKVTVGFAVERVPETWVEALADGGKLVVPVGGAERQTLTLVERDAAGVKTTDLGPVRYVLDRG